MHEVHKAHPDFMPAGLAEWIEGLNESGATQARQLMPEVQLAIREIVLTTLRAEHGQEWWREGVPRRIRVDVVQTQEASEEAGERESFFDLLDYKHIAEDQWGLFDQSLGMGEGKSKKSRLEWFDKLNLIRRKVAHPERGPVSREEVELMGEIESALADVVGRLGKD